MTGKNFFLKEKNFRNKKENKKGKVAVKLLLPTCILVSKQLLVLLVQRIPGYS